MCPTGEVSQRTRASDPNEDTHLAGPVHSSTRQGGGWCGRKREVIQPQLSAEYATRSVPQQPKNGGNRSPHRDESNRASPGVGRYFGADFRGSVGWTLSRSVHRVPSPA